MQRPWAGVWTLKALAIIALKSARRVEGRSTWAGVVMAEKWGRLAPATARIFLLTNPPNPSKLPNEPTKVPDLGHSSAKLRESGSSCQTCEGSSKKLATEMKSIFCQLFHSPYWTRLTYRIGEEDNYRFECYYHCDKCDRNIERQLSQEDLDSLFPPSCLR